MRKGICWLLLLALTAILLPGMAMAEEPTVVTLALWHSFEKIDEWKNSNELRQLEELYNIRLDYQYYDADQFSLMMASGDLPDIVTCTNSYITTVIENGMALDLDPLLAEYCPNMLLDIYAASNELSRKFMGGPDDHLYFVTPGIGPENLNSSDNSYWGYGVRWDLFKEIGAPELNNNDDFIDAMKKMIELYPTTPNGDKVYGLASCDLFARWYQFGCMVMDGGALNPWVFGGTMYMSSWEDTVLYNGYTNTERSAYWTAMRFFNKLYNEGLLDPDSFIMTRDEMIAKYTAGRYVASIPYEGAQLYAEMRKDDPDTLAGIVRIQSPNLFVFADKLALTGNMPSDNIFINAKSPNWEAALKVIDYFHDPDVIRMVYSGVEGVDWVIDETGTPVLTEKAINDMQTYVVGSDDYRNNTGIFGSLTEWTPFQATGVHPDGHPYQLRQEYVYRAMALSPLLKDFAEYFGYSCPSEYTMSFVNEGKTISLIGDYGQMIASGIGEIPMDIKRIMDACSDIAYRALPELVMAATEEEFLAVQARVMKDLEDAGEPVAWEWSENAFNTVKAEMQPIFEEAQAAFLESRNAAN